MVEIKTKYITPDDYREYFGDDLNVLMKDSGNPSNTATAFLKRWEDRIGVFLDTQFYRKIDEEYPHFTDFQKEHYSLALLEQAKYVIENGEIGEDSGYSLENGETASNDTIMKKMISPFCRMHLIECGLWCRAIQPKRGRWGIR